MRLLLDTHFFLWWVADDPRLGKRARAEIAKPGNQVWVSAASLWEIGIKRALGKLEVGSTDLLLELKMAGFEELAMLGRHALLAASLPRHHLDPFDRMLIAQAQLEQMILVTQDSAFSAYEVDRLPA